VRDAVRRAARGVPRGRSRGGAGHLVVCGDDALALRIVEELTVRYGEQVTVVARSAAAGQARRISRLPGVRVIEQADLDREALLAADLRSARALALLRQDDLGNFHAALRAQELNPRLRLVVAIFNTHLGERIRAFFTDCAVLSEASMAAPSFVAAALGEPAPSHVRLAGKTLYLARSEDADAGLVICGLAADEPSAAPRLLASGEPGASLVLAVADGVPRNPLARQRRNPLRTAVRLARLALASKMSLAFIGLLAVLAAGFTLLATAGHYSAGNALYFTLLDAAGTAVTSARLPAPVKVAQFLLTFDGMAFLPLVTAAAVGASLTISVRRAHPPPGDHVIVAGLGNVGTRIAGQLHDLGFDVVCIDQNEAAAGVALARRLGLRVVIGQAYLEETLRSAGIDTCQAFVSVTNSDIVNLESALHARALADRPRVVVRLYDDDLADRVQRTIGNTISRSVSHLAAPAFAAAMLEHQVLRTVPVGRHVLLIAEVPVAEGSDLAGQPIQGVHDVDAVRVIALRRRGTESADWAPPPGYVLAPADRLVVLATRAGLSQVLARSEPRQRPA
jgi:Trk K+ transport system NAD-binding subunit